MLCEVFSDISRHHVWHGRRQHATNVSYCFIVLADGRRIAESVGDLTAQGPMSATTAEIFATALGVESCIHTSDVLAWTDINDLPSIWAGQKVSWQNSAAKALAKLQAARAAFASVEIRRVASKHPWYVECHRRAKNHARKNYNKLYGSPGLTVR